MNEIKDRFPEYVRYKDTGCDLSDHCLACPFPVCIDGEPEGRHHYLIAQRDCEIARLYAGGETVENLSSRFKVGKTTIYRAVKIDE